jgi:acyl-CoA synthetase (NDP forming)
MRQAGALVAEDFREFSQLLESATLLAQKKVENGRIFAVTNAGMEAVAMADAVGADGPATLAPISEPLTDNLKRILGEHSLAQLVGVRNPLDVTPMAGETAYADIVDAALADDGVDALIVSCVPLAPSLHTLPKELDDPQAFPQLAGTWARSQKPVVFVVDSGEEYDVLAKRVRERGVPVFRSADEAMRGLSTWLENRLRHPSGKTEKEPVTS